MAAKSKTLGLAKKNLEAKQLTLKKHSPDGGALDTEMKMARAAIADGQRVICVLAGRVCTGYTT